MSLASCSGLHYFSRLKEDGQLSPERSCILKQAEDISIFNFCRRSRIVTMFVILPTEQRIPKKMDHSIAKCSVTGYSTQPESTQAIKCSTTSGKTQSPVWSCFQIMINEEGNTVQPRCKCLGFVTYLFMTGFAPIRQLKNR